MLSHLWHSYKFDKDSVAINLHMLTILDQTFDTFTRSAGYEWQDKLIVEMPYFEVSEDPESFLEALDILTSHHCLAALDDVPMSKLSKLEQHADRLFSIKLRWTAEMSHLPSCEVEALKKSLKSLKKCHLILTHCETEAAVQVGVDLGFKLIQGRGVDPRIKSLRQDRIDATGPVTVLEMTRVMRMTVLAYPAYSPLSPVCSARKESDKVPLELSAHRPLNPFLKLGHDLSWG